MSWQLLGALPEQARAASVACITFLSRWKITKPHIRKATVRMLALPVSRVVTVAVPTPVECGTKDMQLIAYAMPLDQVGAAGVGSGVRGHITAAVCQICVGFVHQPPGHIIMCWPCKGQGTLPLPHSHAIYTTTTSTTIKWRVNLLGPLACAAHSACRPVNSITNCCLNGLCNVEVL